MSAPGRPCTRAQGSPGRFHHFLHYCCLEPSPWMPPRPPPSPDSARLPQTCPSPIFSFSSTSLPSAQQPPLPGTWRSPAILGPWAPRRAQPQPPRPHVASCLDSTSSPVPSLYSTAQTPTATVCLREGACQVCDFPAMVCAAGTAPAKWSSVSSRSGWLEGPSSVCLRTPLGWGAEIRHIGGGASPWDGGWNVPGLRILTCRQVCPQSDVMYISSLYSTSCEPRLPGPEQGQGRPWGQPALPRSVPGQIPPRELRVPRVYLSHTQSHPKRGRAPLCTLPTLTRLWNHCAWALGPSLCSEGFALPKASQPQSSGRARVQAGPRHSRRPRD